MNQRPSGYRTAPVAVPEICCLLFAAPDFDRGPSSSPLLCHRQRSDLSPNELPTHKKDSPPVDDEPDANALPDERKEPRRELRPDSGGCGAGFGTNDLRVIARRRLRCPKSVACCLLRQISTAALPRPPLFCHRQRSDLSPNELPTHKKTHRLLTMSLTRAPCRMKERV